MKMIGTVLLCLFILIQFIPRKYNDASIEASADLGAVLSVPDQVLSILKTSCYDCHSNETDYPWYYYIQPTALVLEKHIEQGKEELNFSEFGNYSSRRQKNKLRSVASQVDDREMPLRSYTWLHWESKLSEEEVTAIVNWTDVTIQNLESAKLDYVPDFCLRRCTLPTAKNIFSKNLVTPSLPAASL